MTLVKPSRVVFVEKNPCVGGSGHSGFWPPHLQSCRLNLQKILRAAPIQNCEGKLLGSWGYVGKKPSSHFWLTCFPTQTLLSGVAAEALSRNSSQEASAALVDRLSDPVRMVRYTAMTALAHRTIDDWIDGRLTRTIRRP
ncbi:MAG: hypothetical protein Ct9H300mP7_2640 [Verrucomicrobiota bacterium]|nr:MAG: hypothetical protein Ct9H300mP7_2640 [Verrucomicrobiota bacterium]